MTFYTYPMVNNIFTTTVFIVIFMIGILMIALPFIEFQTKTAFAKEIPIKISYNNIAKYKNFDVNALINSSSHNVNTNNVDAFAEKVSTNKSQFLLDTNNNETKKNMSLLSKNTTTTSLDQLNDHNSNNLRQLWSLEIIRHIRYLLQKLY